ncbi:MAG: DUF5839 family protein [Emergencia sp.]
MDTRLKTIAENYGAEEQLMQTVEECAELIQAVNKYRKWCVNEYNFETAEAFTCILAEEVADVEIMLEQLKYLLYLDKSVAKEKERKIQRQMRRINPRKKLIVGHHGISRHEPQKDYLWQLPEHLEDEVKIGDLVEVECRASKEIVIVSKILEQPASECNNRKSVIRKVEYGGDGKWL